MAEPDPRGPVLKTSVGLRLDSTAGVSGSNDRDRPFAAIQDFAAKWVRVRNRSPGVEGSRPAAPEGHRHSRSTDILAC
jgi:hypothetical protein